MTQKKPTPDARIKQGKQLARQLYDHKIRELENLGKEEKARLRAEYPLLTRTEFDDVVRQVIEAKRYEQERIGWQTVPHDIAVLVLVIITALFDLRTGVIACIATLVLFEGIAQFYFNQDIYRPLSTLVWLTYPAYAFFAFLLYKQGFEILWIIIAVLLAWLGTFILGSLARLPLQLILESRVKGRQEGARLRAERNKKSDTKKKKS